MMIQTGDALLIVDAQNDFITGSLAVPGAIEAVPKIRELVEKAYKAHIPIYASMDWHPADHTAFKEHGGIWPSHCVQETEGARIAPGILRPLSFIPDITIIIKGDKREHHPYSAFAGRRVDDISLSDSLQSQSIKRLIVCGFATDFCVKDTVLDALSSEYGPFEVGLVIDAIAAVTVEGGRAAEQAMFEAGAGPRLTDNTQVQERGVHSFT